MRNTQVSRRAVLRGMAAFLGAAAAGVPPVRSAGAAGTVDAELAAFLDGPSPAFVKLFTRFLGPTTSQDSGQPQSFVHESPARGDLRGSARNLDIEFIDTIDRLLDEGSEESLREACQLANGAIETDLLSEVSAELQPRCAITLALAAPDENGYSADARFYLSEFLRVYTIAPDAIEALEVAPAERIAAAMSGEAFTARVEQQLKAYLKHKGEAAANADHERLLQNIYLFETGRLFSAETGMPFIPAVLMQVPLPWGNRFSGLYIDYERTAHHRNYTEVSEILDYVDRHMGGSSFYCLNDDGATDADSFVRKIWTEIHELTHALNFFWMGEALAGRIDEDNPRFVVAQMMFMNSMLHSSIDDEACEARAAWGPRSETRCFQTSYMYNHQFAERMAENMARETMRNLVPAMADILGARWPKLCDALRYEGFHPPRFSRSPLAGLAKRLAPR